MMSVEEIKSVIEAILFSAGRVVSINELVSALEVNENDIIQIINNMKLEYSNLDRGIEIISVDEGYQLCSKPKHYEYITGVFDKRSKPNLSSAAIETLSIIAYNPRITRAEIERIRGVSADATIYKLLEYNLIEEAGKLDLPGRPMGFKTTDEFLKLFGFSNLDELPELPKYKLDENEQIVLDELIENIEKVEVAETVEVAATVVEEKDIKDENINS